jgi:hypothetical protein
MLKVKNSIKRLISSIYECQKRIMINRRFIQDLILDGKEHNVSGLQHEIECLKEKILEFQKELRASYKYSC